MLKEHQKTIVCKMANIEETRQIIFTEKKDINRNNYQPNIAGMEDIQDINDDTALQMILAIQPKTYKYIDKVAKGNKKVYGFIAQQIKEVLPEAVSLQPEYIPNIMLLADYNDHIITLPSIPGAH
jgi:hypothetical protein